MASDSEIRRIVREELIKVLGDIQDAVEHMRRFIGVSPNAVTALDIVIRNARNGLEERNEEA